MANEKVVLEIDPSNITTVSEEALHSQKILHGHGGSRVGRGAPVRTVWLS